MYVILLSSLSFLMPWYIIPRDSHGSMLGHGAIASLQTTILPQMWHETLFDEPIAYRCKKERSVALKICQNTFPAGALPWTPVGSSRCFPRPSSTLTSRGEYSQVLFSRTTHVQGLLDYDWSAYDGDSKSRHTVLKCWIAAKIHWYQK